MAFEDYLAIDEELDAETFADAEGVFDSSFLLPSASLKTKVVPPKLKKASSKRKRGKNDAMLRRPMAWKNWEEWKQVYASLFASEHYLAKCKADHISPDPFKLRLAKERCAFGCAQVEMWRSRRRIPVCLQLTADLMTHLNAIGTIDKKQVMADGSSADDGKDIKDRKAAEHYALCLCLSRAVNRLTDGSGMDWRRALALPMTVLHLRHAIVHQLLPSLSAVKQHCQLLVAFLEDAYWRTQLALLHSATGSILLLTDTKAFVASIGTAKKSKHKSVAKRFETSFLEISEELASAIGKYPLFVTALMNALLSDMRLETSEERVAVLALWCHFVLHESDYWTPVCASEMRHIYCKVLFTVSGALQNKWCAKLSTAVCKLCRKQGFGDLLSIHSVKQYFAPLKRALKADASVQRLTECRKAVERQLEAIGKAETKAMEPWSICQSQPCQFSAIGTSVLPAIHSDEVSVAYI